MPKFSKVGGRRPNVGASDANVKEGEKSKGAGQTRPVERIDHHRLDPDEIPVPEFQEGFSAQQTPLQGAIEAGLTKLAAAEGFQAQDKALGVLVRAMAGAAAPPVPPQSQAPILEGELRQVLGAAPTEVSSAELRQDAAQLLTLATTALGAEGLPTSKVKAEAVLSQDLRIIKDALADVLKRVDSRTVKRLQDTQTELSWAADVLSRGKPALDKTESGAGTRMDALVGVLRIVQKYAQHGA